MLRFHVEVFPNSSGLKPFGDVQLNSIAHSQRTIIEGGRVAKAEPRGYGKSTRCANEAIWATAYNYRRFVVILTSGLKKSKEILAGIRRELESNPILAGMFPGLCHPFRCLEGFSIKGISQHIDGSPTEIEMTSSLIRFPTVEGLECSGNLIGVMPLTNARGAHYRLPDGTVLRPDFVILDDIQTTKDALSELSVERIMGFIRQDVMRLGSHDRTLSAIMACTVIRENDASEQILQDPSWTPVRYQMLLSPSDNEQMWLGDYANLRRDCDPADPEGKTKARQNALAYYRRNRRAMDSGATVSWKWAFAYNDSPQTEISAIQHAYNILIDDGEDAFLCECQNSPRRKHDDVEFLTVSQLCEKQHSAERTVPPRDTSKLFAFVDVQREVLFWHVWAFSTAFDGYCIDRGTHPDQRRFRFQKSRLYHRLSDVYAGKSDTITYLAVLDLWKMLCQRRYRRQGDLTEFSISLIGTDRRYRSSIIDNAWHDFAERERIIPCMGQGYGASKRPMSERQRRKGDEKGPHWFRSRAERPGDVRKLEIDTNWYKSFVHYRFATHISEDGSFSFWTTEQSRDHLQTAQHLKAEYRTTVLGPWGKVDEWRENPTSPDNDELDCIAGVAAVASYGGIQMPGARLSPVRRGPRKVDLKKYAG